MSSQPDICLVLEGTYPFVPGGVSSWVHQLVSAMPDLRFCILHITPRPDFFDKCAYQVPDNVVAVDQVYLQKPVACRARRLPRVEQAKVEAFCRGLDAMRRGAVDDLLGLARDLRRTGDPQFTSLELLASPEHWDVLMDCYRAEAEDVSFLNYYWNWLFAQQPLLNVLTEPLPEARAYHTVSTGYAGLLASFAAERYRRPMMLTEHGIYTRERRIEIHAAEWVPAGPDEIVPDVRAPYFQAFWNRHFLMMSQVCYARAQRIFTLYTGNKEEQVRDGADPDKIEVVPNGIDLGRFEAAAIRYDQRPRNGPFTIGFVGRVCPIKDVRTFIAAACLAAAQIPDLRARIMGPLEEDPGYVDECRRFITAMGMEDVIEFTGRVSLDAELDKLDVMVLTSISEAQPLVILEAGAVGIPVVSTDVGSCEEMLFGRSAADRSLGAGGIVTPISSPGSTAKALIELYHDPDLRRQLGQNLKSRVARYFEQREMLAIYRDAYESLVAQPTGEAS